MNGVQINLLPSGKADSVKNQANQRHLLSLARRGALASVGLLVLLMLVVWGLQKKQLTSADKSLADHTTQLSNVADLNKILTVKNQLSTLKTLHQEKFAAERLFKYLPQVTPARATINSLTLDFKNSALDLAGNADSLQTVNAFIDTLKFTQFTTDTDTNLQTAFPTVVESGFSLGSGTVTYGLSIKFAPALFDNHAAAVNLKIPAEHTTRTVQDVNGNLFSGGR